MSREYFSIHCYQDVAGPLTELDPNTVLAAISEDFNDLINRAMGFVINGSLGDSSELSFQLPKTFGCVSNELAERGVVLEGQTALSYANAIQAVAKEYLITVSQYTGWFTHYGKWLGASYSRTRPGSVEFALDFDIVKFPEYVVPGAWDSITPKLLPVLDMLIGNLGGRL